MTMIKMIVIYAAGLFAGSLLPLYFDDMAFFPDAVALAASYALLLSLFCYLGARRAGKFPLMLISAAGFVNGFLYALIITWLLQTFPIERKNTVGLCHIINVAIIFLVPYFSGKYFLIRSRRNKSEN